LGTIAITLFLVLSGLTLELNYRSRELSYGEFMVNRILRIYPVYWSALLLGIVIYVWHSVYLSPLPSLDHRVPDLLLSISGFSAFAGRWGGPFVGTSWFIGLIMTLYLLHPFVSRGIKRWPHLTIVLALSLTALSRYIIVERWDILPGLPLAWFPLCQLFWFVLGIYLVRVLKQGFWLCLNRVGRIIAPILAFISEISFPLFLVHLPLLGIITNHDRLGISQSASIVVWLVVSIVTSWIILITTNRLVPRERITRRLFTHGASNSGENK
jgi:peptidoglycan/LPS O-acetylase OafA/YrhL